MPTPSPTPRPVFAVLLKPPPPIGEEVGPLEDVGGDEVLGSNDAGLVLYIEDIGLILLGIELGEVEEVAATAVMLMLWLCA